jgi:hypothetical protein
MRKIIVTMLLLAGACTAIMGTNSAMAGNSPPKGSADWERASRAALEATGGGTVQDVDRDSEGGATWEVEVIKSDGTHVDVLLDGQFKVMSVSSEQEPNEHSDGSDDHGDDD